MESFQDIQNHVFNFFRFPYFLSKITGVMPIKITRIGSRWTSNCCFFGCISTLVYFVASSFGFYRFSQCFDQCFTGPERHLPNVSRVAQAAHVLIVFVSGTLSTCVQIIKVRNISSLLERISLVSLRIRTKLIQEISKTTSRTTLYLKICHAGIVFYFMLIPWSLYLTIDISVT